MKMKYEKEIDYEIQYKKYLKLCDDFHKKQMIHLNKREKLKTSGVKIADIEKIVNDENCKKLKKCADCRVLLDNENSTQSQQNRKSSRCKKCVSLRNKASQTKRKENESNTSN